MNPFVKSPIAAALIAAFLPMGALAQQANSPATLPEVVVRDSGDTAVVTAKQATVGALGDLPLIQTPYSVNVLTRDLMDRQQVTFIGEVLKNDPSVQVGNVAVPFMTLRGFSLGVDGTLYDGMPGNGGLSDGRAGLSLIDHIEVLKGATSFLNGAGAAASLGGTINYVPKRPDLGRVRDISFGYANDAQFSTSADLGDRFGEGGQFGYRLNAGWRDGEQAVDRYDWQQSAIALALDWRVKPGLVFNVGYEHVSNQIPTLPPFYFLNGPTKVPDAPNTHRSAALSWDNFRTTSDTYTARADWEFAPDWSMTAQMLHNESGRPGTKQARFGMIINDQGDALMLGGQEVSESRNDSAQVLVHGKVRAESLEHRLTFGLSGSRQDAYGNYYDYLRELGIAFPTNIYNPKAFTDLYPELATVDLDNLHTTRVDNKSVFASDVIAFNKQWSVLLGARYTDLSVENFGADPNTNSISKTLPTAALMYNPTATSLVYLSYAEGLEQGGAANVMAGAPFLPPLMTHQVELGTKLEYAGVTYTAALFNMVRPLETAASADPLPDGTPAKQQGEQRHRGIELIANGQVTKQLTIVSGVMLLDSELSGTPGTDGNRAKGVPKFTANLWGEYRIAEVPGLALNAGVYYSGSQYYDDANTLKLPSWTRFDIGASYTTRLNGVPSMLLLTVENVADKSYWASAQGGILTMADPLTVKLGARLSF